MTNRDLYLAVDGLVQLHKSSGRTLEQYLSALLVVTRPHSALESLPVGDFIQLLSDAFVVEPLPFAESWRTQSMPDDSGYPAWEATLVGQIVDLREMDEARDLENELRYFGMPSPRGSYWFNFDPATFLECGMTGSFGGWEEGDSTGRSYVDGQVATLDATGHIVSSRPEDIDNPIFEIADVSWAQFRDFLECGQQYE